MFLSMQYLAFAGIFGVLLCLNVYQILGIEPINPRRVSRLHFTLHRAVVFSGGSFVVSSVFFALSETSDWTNFGGIVCEDLAVVLGLGFLMRVTFESFTSAIMAANAEVDGFVQKVLFAVLFGVLFGALAIKNVLMIFLNSTFYQGILVFVVCIVNLVIIAILWSSFFELRKLMMVTNSGPNRLSLSNPSVSFADPLTRFQIFAICITLFLIIGSAAEIATDITNILNPKPFLGSNDNATAFSWAALCGVLVYAWTTFYTWLTPASLVAPQMIERPEVNPRANNSRVVGFTLPVGSDKAHKTTLSQSSSHSVHESPAPNADAPAAPPSTSGRVLWSKGNFMQLALPVESVASQP